MSMEWVRKNYGVPAKRGGRVEYTGDKSGPRMGTIIRADGGRLRIRLDGDDWAGAHHPTWALRYLEIPPPQPRASVPATLKGEPAGVGVGTVWMPPQDCDGKEQLAFEAWASGERYDMHEHPLHYLFMDKKTNAARQGWKAALKYVREQHAFKGDEQ